MTSITLVITLNISCGLCEVLMEYICNICLHAVLWRSYRHELFSLHLFTLQFGYYG